MKTVRQVHADGMTPLALSILVHFYAVREPYYRPSNAYADAIKNLTSMDMLRKIGEGTTISRLGTKFQGSIYETTEKGDYYIQHLLNTPLPKQRCHWEIPHRKDGGQT